MKKLWRDITSHRGVAALFLVYWLATVATVPFAWRGGIPPQIVALLLSNSLISGALVSWWRRPTAERTGSVGERIRGGILAGVLSAEITLLVIKGGIAEELIGWMRGARFQGGEVLEFAIAVAVLGVFLGLVGSACSLILCRRANVI